MLDIYVVYISDWILQFWIRFYEKLKEKFPAEEGLNSKQTRYLLKTLLGVSEQGTYFIIIF